MKPFLKTKGQKVTGNKRELALSASVFQNDKFIKDIQKQTIYILSESGNQKVLDFLMFKTYEREEAEKKTIEFLESHDYKSACLTMIEYEKQQVFPRGMGIDWNHYNPKDDISALKSMFSSAPKILKGISNEKLKILQIAGAMKFLYGTSSFSKYLPNDFETGTRFDCETASRMLTFVGYHQRNLASYRAYPSVTVGVEILNAPGCCEECNKLNGKKFKLDEVIELPYEHCTHEMGCRCTIIPLTVLSS